jgi:hypothetical protein
MLSCKLSYKHAILQGIRAIVKKADLAEYTQKKFLLKLGKLLFQIIASG